MYTELTEYEKSLLDKLGMSLHGDEKISYDNLIYTGFGSYLSLDNRVFEKQGEELLEVTSPEILAEQRYLENIKK